MSEDVFSVILVIVALFVIFTLVFLIPQALGLGAYRLLKPRGVFLAALTGFSVPLILYAAAVSYFWFGASPAPDNTLTGGEGDMVGPAITVFGFILNAGGSAALYLYLYVRNKQPAASGKSGTQDLP